MKIHTSLITTGSIAIYSPIPPQMPAKILFLLLLRNFFIFFIQEPISNLTNRDRICTPCLFSYAMRLEAFLIFCIYKVKMEMFRNGFLFH